MSTPDYSNPIRHLVAPGQDRAVTIYADLVLNFANTGQIVKFYLARVDPSPQPLENPDPRTEIAAQVVMPLQEFLVSFGFLEKMVGGLVKSGAVTPEQLEQARAVNTDTQ